MDTSSVQLESGKQGADFGICGVLGANWLWIEPLEVGPTSRAHPARTTIRAAGLAIR